jgi:hypothetical protein
MIDVGYAGNPFTWNNNRKGLENIKERLDRGLASPSWVHLHLEYSLVHLPAHNSDHHPITYPQYKYLLKLHAKAFQI